MPLFLCMIFFSLANIIAGIWRVNWTTGCAMYIVHMYTSWKQRINQSVTYLTSKNDHRTFPHDIVEAMKALVTISKQWNFLFLSPRFFYPKNGLLVGMLTWLAKVKTLPMKTENHINMLINTPITYMFLTHNFHLTTMKILQDNTVYVHRTAGKNLSHCI